MTDFYRALDVIFGVEGYDKIIVDEGGLTKYGISQRAYPDVDIRNLTEPQAATIYQRDYWTPVQGDKLKWPLNLYVFDAAVNQGQNAAIKMLQTAAGGLSVDGVMGAKTIARVNQRDPQELGALFMARRALRYIGTRHFDVNGYGWFARLFRVAANAQ